MFYFLEREEKMEEKIRFKHHKKIEEYLKCIKDIIEQIDLEDKELNYKNLEFMKCQSQKLEEIERNAHQITNCLGFAIKNSSDATDELIIRDLF